MSLREALLTLSNKELDFVFKEALRLLEERKTRGQGDDFHPEFLNIKEAFNETVNFNWIIPGLVLEGTVNFLVGAGGRGKSLLAIYLGAELATGLVGGYFTENDCPSLKTLIINLEDPQEILKKRLQIFIKPNFSNLINVLNRNLKIWPAIGQLGKQESKDLACYRSIRPPFRKNIVWPQCHRKLRKNTNGHRKRKTTICHFRSSDEISWAGGKQ